MGFDDQLLGLVLENEVSGAKRLEVDFRWVPHVVVWVAALDLVEFDEGPGELVIHFSLSERLLECDLRLLGIHRFDLRHGKG